MVAEDWCLPRCFTVTQEHRRRSDVHTYIRTVCSTLRTLFGPALAAVWGVRLALARVKNITTYSSGLSRDPGERDAVGMVYLSRSSSYTARREREPGSEESPTDNFFRTRYARLGPLSYLSATKKPHCGSVGSLFRGEPLLS